MAQKNGAANSTRLCAPTKRDRRDFRRKEEMFVHSDHSWSFFDSAE
jgi:hypothetical protein